MRSSRTSARELLDLLTEVKSWYAVAKGVQVDLTKNLATAKQEIDELNGLVKDLTTELVACRNEIRTLKSRLGE
jgi:predicted  nucleic acid-binding Zn-ribbon protein